MKPPTRSGRWQRNVDCWEPAAESGMRQGERVPGPAARSVGRVGPGRRHAMSVGGAMASTAALLAAAAFPVFASPTPPPSSYSADLQPSDHRARASAYIATVAGVAQYTVLRDGRLTAKDPLIVPPNDSMGGIAVSPDGCSVYVTQSFLPGSEHVPAARRAATALPARAAGLRQPVTPGRAVLQYSVEPHTGRLTPMSAPSAPSGRVPVGIAVSSDRRSAYVANALDDTISQYRVDHRTGALSPNNPATVPSGDNPIRVAISSDGRSVYVTNSGGNSISQYSIDRRTGALSPKTPATVAAPGQPTGIAMTPDGRNVYVAVRAGLLHYTVDAASGRLTPGSPSFIPVGIAPNAVAVAPDGRSAYVGFQDGIAQFTIDRSTGQPTPKTPPVVPVGTNRFPDVSAITITPDGRNAYVTSGNAESTTAFQFSIDHRTGTLAPKVPADVPAGFTQNAVVVTPHKACHR